MMIAVASNAIHKCKPVEIVQQSVLDLGAACVCAEEVLQVLVQGLSQARFVN